MHECPKCHESFFLHQMTHAPGAWGSGKEWVCRDCKREIQKELKDA